MSIRYTAVIATETPRGIRFRGVSYSAGGREWRVKRYADAPGDVLPRKAIVHYQSPLRVNRGAAYELARDRSIAHNLSSN